MVLIQLDIIEFLLIYRYLQNTYWFKRENLSLEAINKIENALDIHFLQMNE